MVKMNVTNYSLNNINLINFHEFAENDRNALIAQIIENWDHKRYLQPVSKYEIIHHKHSAYNQHLWWKTIM